MAPVSAVAGGSSKTCQLWTYFGGRARGTCWQASSGCESRREGVFGPHNKKNKVAIHWNKESCKSSKFVGGGDLGNLVWDMLNWEILRSSSLEVLGWQLDLRVWSQRVRHVLHG